MCKKRVSERLKGQMYLTMVRPVMMYGMECVLVTRSQEKKIQVAEVKMLRWSVGLKLKTNEQVPAGVTGENLQKK